MNDARALELRAQFIRPLRAWAFELSGQYAEAGELEAAGWAALCLAADRFDAERAPAIWPYAWRRVRGAMRDLVRDALPFTSRHFATPFRLESLDALAAENTEPQVDTFDKLVAPLAPRDRELFRLLYVYDWPMHRAGEALGVTESRVSQLHTAGLARLRRHHTH